MKKMMIIPLVILIIAITSFPVAAITSDNDVYIDFYGRAYKAGVNSTYHYMQYVTTGNLNYFQVQETLGFSETNIDGEEYCRTEVQSSPTIARINVQFACLYACDLWICTPFAMALSDFNNLADYYDSSSYFYSVQQGSYTYNLNYSISDSSTCDLDTLYTNDLADDYTDVRTWYFYKFNDVPAGSYYLYLPRSKFFEFDNGDYFDSHWYTGFGVIAEKIPDDSNSSSNPIGGGSGGSGGSGEGNTYLDPWYSPDADLTTNMESITDTLDAAISSAGSVFEQIFYAVYASYQLEQIVFVSDQHNVQQTQVFNTSLSNVISNFESGVTEYPTALDQMATNYQTALQTAETPEQGNYITAVYQAKQQELYARAVQDAGEKIKEVITDEDLTDLDDYTQLESDLLDNLDMQQLEDLITYQSWLNLLPVDEAMTYRTIFDFFVNDAVWKYWILIPFTFIIVSILLGTGVSMLGRSVTINRMHARYEARNARRKG